MEIYTGDFLGMAQSCAARISKRIGYTGYVVEDECCNLQHDIRKKIYDRLSVAFNTLIDQEKIGDIEHAYLKDDLKECDLKKIIDDKIIVEMDQIISEIPEEKYKKEKDYTENRHFLLKRLNIYFNNPHFLK